MEVSHPALARTVDPLVKFAESQNRLIEVLSPLVQQCLPLLKLNLSTKKNVGQTYYQLKQAIWELEQDFIDIGAEQPRVKPTLDEISMRLQPGNVKARFKELKSAIRGSKARDYGDTTSSLTSSDSATPISRHPASILRETTQNHNSGSSAVNHNPNNSTLPNPGAFATAGGRTTMTGASSQLNHNMNQTATGNISGGVTFSDNSRPGYADDSRDHAESTLSTAQRGFSQYNTQGDDPTFGNETSEENVNIDQTALDMSHKSPLELLKAQPLIKKDLEQTRLFRSSTVLEAESSRVCILETVEGSIQCSGTLSKLCAAHDYCQGHGDYVKTRGVKECIRCSQPLR
mmetsp:Transcript_31260/g.35599  ORF Transcript_31260/g.35599 Transcript_31260/m.35599 type:complete len:345 (+) Transcript_31260:24-1058(+)